MKAITILQPWATLIAIGEKRFETRGWATKHRGDLAIHAGKKVEREICEQEPFRSVLASHGYTADNLPTGVVVATCQLTNCHEVKGMKGNVAARIGDEYRIVEGNEFAFGRYDFGRFAWELSDVRKLPEPIPAKGQQGLWKWEGDPIAGQGY